MSLPTVHMPLNVITDRTHAPKTFRKQDLVPLYLQWHWWLYRIILCYIVSPIIASNLMMAKSEMAETYIWYGMYNSKYRWLMSAMSMRHFPFMFCYERVISFKFANNFNTISKFTFYRTKTHCVFIINTNYTMSFREIFVVDSEKHTKGKVRFFLPSMKAGGS
jgi:hypothetical protein